MMLIDNLPHSPSESTFNATVGHVASTCNGGEIVKLLLGAPV
jgi:hypothetical protein